MELLFLLALLLSLIIFTCEGIGVLMDKSVPFFVWFGNNIYLFLGTIFLISSIFAYFYLKSHPAEKYFNEYEKGLVSEEVAIANIAKTLLLPKYVKLPSIFKLSLESFRLNRFSKNIKAKTDFMNTLTDYINNKERAKIIEK